MGLRRLLILVAVLCGCGGVDVNADDPDAAPGTDPDGAPEDPDAAAPDGGSDSVVLRYDFDAGLVDDGGARYVPDLGGSDRRGIVVGAVGGETLLEVVAREEGTGNAIRFPGQCEEPDPMNCPRVMIEAQGSADENPGERDFAVTVDFLMASNQDGAVLGDQNVMQKGNFDDPGQWKIEIDVQNRASCVFHHPGDDGAPIIARVQRAVNDGVWHTLRCERRGALLTILLDAGTGDDTRSIEIPAGDTVDITNDKTIRIGGQDVMASSDQFHGSLDDITVEIF